MSSMSYVILGIGCILVCLSQQPPTPLPPSLTNIFLCCGIVSMIQGVTWDHKR